MTKHVEVWTLSKESRVVPYMINSVELYEYYPPPDMYVMDGKFEDRVERKYMDIIQITKHERLYTSLGGTVPNRIDKYIAIHPDVEEAISVKWREKIDEKDSELRSVYKHVASLLVKIEDFNNLPWYKRVWRALWNSI